MKILSPGLVRKIEVSVVQRVALSQAKIWWNIRPSLCEKLQNPINRQSRVVAGMLRLAPTNIVTGEARVQPAPSQLNNRESRYKYKLLAASQTQPTRDISPRTPR